jgi:CMD domain protein
MVSATRAVTTDVINAILGVDDGDRIAELRNKKPLLAEQLQAYYSSIFEPEEASIAALPLTDRFLVAVRVASHTGSTAVVRWYGDLATSAGVSSEQLERARDIGTPWSEPTRLGAAIRHADLLTTRPSDARPSDLRALKDAGLSPAGIVSLSQVIAFVSYQLRLIAGLRAFGVAS